MNVTAIAAYLEHREHADPDAARRAARQIVDLREDRYFFRAWWLEVVAACVADSPALHSRLGGLPADRLGEHAGAVLDRLAVHLGVRVSDAYLPHCPRCHTPLRLRDIRVPVPTGRCRPCSRPPAHQPAPAPRRSVRTARPGSWPEPVDLLGLLEVA